MADTASEGEKAIIRRACVLITELERMEAGFAIRGHAELGELETYQRCSSTMRRLLESVGLQRRARTIGPSLGDVLRNGIEQQRERDHVDQPGLPP